MAESTGEYLYKMALQTNSVADGTATVSPTNLWSWMNEWVVNTPHVEIEGKTKRSPSGINPRLYFKYVKSKLRYVENAMFKSRMKQLEKLADEYEKLGQEALSEECIKQFLVISRESAMFACGFDMFVSKLDLEKFRYSIKGDLKITPLKNFTRIIPKKAANKIRKAMDRKLFDEYVVVHLDNKEVDSVKETQKEKIVREKDPICFGKVAESDKFYFVSDWEDEHDDLRFEDIIKKLSLDKKKLMINKKIEMKGLGKKEHVEEKKEV